MTRADLIAAIRSANTTGRWATLVSSTSGSAPEQVRVIFGLAIEQQSIDATVYDAARLLYEARPNCPISCERAVEDMLDSWDVSIEEVPWYLRNQFGTDFVRDAVANVRQRTTCDRNNRILNTIEYWLGCEDTNGS